MKNSKKSKHIYPKCLLICMLLFFFWHLNQNRSHPRPTSKIIDNHYTMTVKERLEKKIKPQKPDENKMVNDPEHIPFDTVFINLDRDKSRALILKKELKKQGFEAKRFSAIDGKKLNITWLKEQGVIEKQMAEAMSMKKKFFKFKSQQQFKSGQLGIMLSHILLLKESMQQDNQYILVLEDDVMMPDGFLKIVKNAILQLEKSDFDIVQLSGRNDVALCEQSKFKFLHQHLCNGDLDPRRELKASKIIQPARFTLGAWAYVIKKKSIPKYIDHFSMPLLKRPKWINEKAKFRYWAPLDVVQWLFEDVKIATIYPYVIEAESTMSWKYGKSTTENS